MALAGLGFSGSDWLGIGEAFGSATQGTVECGAKPTCISFNKNSVCAKSKEAYSKCLIESQKTQQQALTAQQQILMQQMQKKQVDAEAQRKTVLIIVVSLAALAVIISLIYAFKK